MENLSGKINNVLQYLHRVEQLNEADRIKARADVRRRLKTLIAEIKLELKNLGEPDSETRKLVLEIAGGLYKAALASGSIAKAIEVIQTLL